MGRCEACGKPCPPGQYTNEDIADARVWGHGDGQVHALEDVLQLKQYSGGQCLGHSRHERFIRVSEVKALLPKKVDDGA
jgi:hypothetical protein